MSDENRARVNTVPDLADATFISYCFIKKDALLTFKIESWDCKLILIVFKKISYFVDHFGGGCICSLWQVQKKGDFEHHIDIKSPDLFIVNNIEMYQFNANSCEGGFDIEDRTYDIAAEEVFGQQYDIDCEPLLFRSRAESSATYEVEDQLTGLTLAGSELISYERWGYSLMICFKDKRLNTVREFTFHKAIFFAHWGAQKIDTLSCSEGMDRVMQTIGRFDTTPPNWRSFKHYRFTGEGGEVALEVVAAGMTSKLVNS